MEASDQGERRKNESHTNVLVSPMGIPGKVKISTVSLSKGCMNPAIVSVDTAITMIEEMGGSPLKFFPMAGLKTRGELKSIAKACAGKDFCLKPTGGIDLDNFEEILGIIIDAGVERIIPHIYSSIIDKSTGCTKIECVEQLLNMGKTLV